MHLLEPQQGNLSNPEPYSEPCQTCITFFLKTSILHVCQSSEYAYVIFYVLFGKIEDNNNIDLVTM